MTEAAVLSVSAVDVKSTIRRRSSEVGFSDRYLFAPGEAAHVAEKEAAHEAEKEGETSGDAASSGVIGDETRFVGVAGSPASRRFELLRETSWLARWGESAAWSAQAAQASDLVSLLERIAEEGDDLLTVCVAEAYLGHTSSAVRASAIGALEPQLATNPALVARLNWIRSADPSPAVRAVAGEVLDYLD